jgi:hypothetical protein
MKSCAVWIEAPEGGGRLLGDFPSFACHRRHSLLSFRPLPLFTVHVDSFQNRGLIESLSTLVGSEGIILPNGVPFEPPSGSDASMIDARKLALEALRLNPDKSTTGSPLALPPDRRGNRFQSPLGLDGVGSGLSSPGHFCIRELRSLFSIGFQTEFYRRTRICSDGS